MRSRYLWGELAGIPERQCLFMLPDMFILTHTHTHTHRHTHTHTHTHTHWEVCLGSRSEESWEV